MKKRKAGDYEFQYYKIMPQTSGYIVTVAWQVWYMKMPTSYDKDRGVTDPYLEDKTVTKDYAFTFLKDVIGFIEESPAYYEE